MWQEVRKLHKANPNLLLLFRYYAKCIKQKDVALTSWNVSCVRWNGWEIFSQEITRTVQPTARSAPGTRAALKRFCACVNRCACAELFHFFHPRLYSRETNEHVRRQTMTINVVCIKTSEICNLSKECSQKNEGQLTTNIKNIYSFTLR